MDTQILATNKSSGRRATIISMADTQHRAELHTLHAKYQRLERKEKRIQVYPIRNENFFDTLVYPFGHANNQAKNTL